MKQSLQDRIKQATKAAAPSMVPEGIKPKQPKPKKEYESEVLPDIQEVITDSRTRLALLRLVGAQAAFNEQIRECRKAAKPLSAQIKNLLEKKELKFMCDGNRVVAFVTPRSHIDADKLLALGVPIHKIKAATVTKPSYTLKITPPTMKPGEDEEEGEDE